jgi:hypothetical protein
VLYWIISPNQTELINYETITIKYCQCLSAFFPTLYRNAQRNFLIEYYIIIRYWTWNMNWTFPLNFVWNFNVMIVIQRLLISNADRPSCTVTDTLYIFSYNINFLDRFPKIHKYQITRKYVPYERSCWMLTDREMGGKDDAKSRLSLRVFYDRI